jgi:hypothetical protein
MKKLAFLLRILKAYISDRNRMFCFKLEEEKLPRRLVMCLRTEKNDSPSSCLLNPLNIEVLIKNPTDSADTRYEGYSYRWSLIGDKTSFSL